MEAPTTPLDYELVTAFDLSNAGEEPKKIFQFVYATQILGTLLGIYGRFATTITTSQCQVHSIELKLLNYQGVINFGFTEDEIYGKPIYHRNDLLDKSEVYFGVIGLGKNRTKKIDIPEERPLIIKKGDRYRLTFKRISYPLTGFISSPNDTDYSRAHGDVPDQPHFDSEFNSRSGIDYFPNPLRPGMAGCNNVTLASLRDDKKMVLGSPRCSESDVNLYF